MARVRQLTLLLLVALWLPATLHCDFQAVGLDELFHCATDHHSPAATSTDSCDVVENGWMKRISPLLAVAAPSLCACLFSFSPPVLDHAPGAPVVRLQENAGSLLIARTWQFIVRAALPARAPSLRA